MPVTPDSRLEVTQTQVAYNVVLVINRVPFLLSVIHGNQGTALCHSSF